VSSFLDLPLWRKAFLPAIAIPSGSTDTDVERVPFAVAVNEVRALNATRAGGPKVWIARLVDYIEIDLDLPPSVNELFIPAAGRKKGSGRQRVKTDRYKAWITAAGWQLKAACTAARARLDPKDPPFASNFGLWLRLDTDHRSDITNQIKAIEDLFVAMGLTTGDQWNDRCTVERDRTIPEGKARIVVYLIPESE
tara:strand:+ start:943 stop:1527 length:585 start_codon:yes stop_codon:yes gene_type:complete